MMQVFLVAILLLTNFSIAVAEPISEADIPVRYITWHIAYDVNVDGSYVKTQSWSGTILKENALEGEKKASVTFSTSTL